MFHDALAGTEASVHVTFGCNEPTGLDWRSYFWERAVADSRVRAYPPPTDSSAGEAALDPRSLAAIKAFQRGFGVERNTYDLPNL